MSDLISRQAAIDEIRKCRFVVDAIEKIRGLPATADVVEVVRCKDCKYYTLKPQQTSRVTSVRRCNRSAIVCTKPDDFCSFGERKEE